MQPADILLDEFITTYPERWSLISVSNGKFSKTDIPTLSSLFVWCLHLNLTGPSQLSSRHLLSASLPDVVWLCNVRTAGCFKMTWKHVWRDWVLTESKYNMMELLPVWDVIPSLPPLGLAVQQHLVTCWCSWLKWMDGNLATQSWLVPYQTVTGAKLGHSEPGLHPFWWGSKGLCADLSFALQPQGILLRVFCVCET